jgi:anti-sigma factor RsiW
MSHPHDALLQAHLDGELAPPEMREVTRHLSVCDACRRASAELARSSYSFSEMIGRIDDTEPLEWRAAALLPASAAPATHFRAGPRLPTRPRLVLEHRPRTRTRTRPRTRTRTLATWRWAAAALLAVTSVAAAAVVRGPLFHGSSEAVTEAGARPLALPAATLQPAGAIAIAPRHDQADVVLTGAAAGSRLHITVTKGAELTVSVRTDSASAEPARFRTGDARIAVQLPSSISLVEVTIPASTRETRVLVGDSVAVTVEDGRVSPAAAAAGGIVLGAHP